MGIWLITAHMRNYWTAVKITSAYLPGMNKQAANFPDLRNRVFDKNSVSMTVTLKLVKLLEQKVGNFQP